MFVNEKATMSTTLPKADYLLLFRGTDWDSGLSPEEIQKVMNQLMAWFEGLHQQGRIKAGQPLGEEGRTVSGKKGRIVADGPFAESKEAVGGYLIVRASDLDEAVAIAKGFPCLNHGGIVEVRPVVEECPTFQRAKEQLGQAAAPSLPHFETPERIVS
jgi:hypothetical protein